MSGTRLILEGLNAEKQKLQASSSFSDNNLTTKYAADKQDTAKILNGYYHPNAFKPTLSDDLILQQTAPGSLEVRRSNSEKSKLAEIKTTNNSPRI